MDLQEVMALILAAPDEEGPRLVYADWLQERGDPLGELIQLQCELDHLPVDGSPRRSAIKRREAELMKAHEQAWLPAFDPPDSSLLLRIKHRRGFVEEAAVRLVQLGKDLAALLEKTPFVRRLIVLGPPQGVTPSAAERVASLRELEAFAAVEQIATLELRDPAIGDEEAVALSGLSRLSGLTSLKCIGHKIGDGGAEALASCHRLASLRELVLPRGAIGDEGAKAIAASPELSRLTHLDLSYNSIGTVGADALRGWLERHAAGGFWIVAAQGTLLRLVEGEQFVIGSGPLCEVVLRAPSIRREHLALYREKDGWLADVVAGQVGVDGMQFRQRVLTEGTYRLGQEEVRVVRKR